MENNSDKVNSIDLTSTSTDNQVHTIITETVINEISLTESVTMEGAKTHSTPIQNKQNDNNDIVNMIQVMLEKQSMMLSNNFNEFKGEMNSKLNALNKRFDTNDAKFEQYKEQNMKFENSINVKLNILTNSLCSIDERINEILSETKRETDESVSYTHLDVYKRQI